MGVPRKLKLIGIMLPIVIVLMWMGLLKKAEQPSDIAFADNVSFPDVNVSFNGKTLSLADYRSSAPVLVMMIDQESGAFLQAKRDFDDGISYLEKKQIKYLIVLPGEPKSKVDFPYFVDKDRKLASFVNLLENNAYSAVVLDQKGTVVLSNRETRSSHLDIPRIMQFYNRKQSNEKGALDIDYAQYPVAPNIDAVDLHGKRFRLFEQRDKAAALVFFSINCPYCRQEMPLLVELSQRPDVTIVGICSLGEEKELEKFIKEYSIPFSIIKDSDREIFSRYSSLSIPETFIVNKAGLISYHHSGMSPDLKYILKVELDKALGINAPEKLPPGAYLGARVCRTCHLKEYNDWLATPHSISFYSLDKELPINKKDFSSPEMVKELIEKKILTGDKDQPEQVKFIGIENEMQLRNSLNSLKLNNNIVEETVIRWRASQAYTNSECLKCHVTGFQKPGGFQSLSGEKHLVNIQCEVCHGMAGGHTSNDTIKGKESFKKVCLDCHTEKYSLKFPFDEAYKLMSHSGNDDYSKYPEEVRQKIIRKVITEQTTKLRMNIAYVGSKACRDCHLTQYQAWEKTKHADSYNTLKNKQKQADASCLRCHTTGYGLKGGFAPDTGNEPGVTSVGCEVCHGPGGDHIKAQGEDLKRTIFGLSKKCQYCVIENICDACHDKANSPKFNIESYLGKVKH